MANGRCAKNIIPSVKVGNNIITDQVGKKNAFDDSFDNLLGNMKIREHSIDLSAIGVNLVDLSDMDGVFTEEEVWGVIRELPADHAPGPDSFIGLFYEKAWSIIKPDIMTTLLKLYVGDGCGSWVWCSQ